MNLSGKKSAKENGQIIQRLIYKAGELLIQFRGFITVYQNNYYTL